MTKCPLCKTVELHPSYYDNTLPISECGSCGGAWLRANEYALWLKTQTPGKFNLANVEPANRLPVSDSHQPALCPDCGHFLRKYKVGANFNFHLNRCHNCNGVWLDRNEWQSLKIADLHDEINQIFTHPWQKQVQDAITARDFDAIYLQKFGPDDYEKIKAIRAWLKEHPDRNMLIAFLLDRDPYSA